MKKRNSITTDKLENWVGKLLEEFDADILFKILHDQCDKKQFNYLVDAIKDELRRHDKYLVECTNLIEKEKFEAFIEEYKPFYNDQVLFY
jgi:GTPase SAR1 family protein